MRQWHEFEDGVCACGARETKLTPASLPAPEAEAVDEPPFVETYNFVDTATGVTTPVAPPTDPVVTTLVERRAVEPPADPGLVCPSCETATESEVIDSRPQPGRVKRRRVCLSCRGRFTTYERVGTESDDRRKVK
jgi:hypothetical protein